MTITLPMPVREEGFDLPTAARMRAAETVAELDELVATMRRETRAYSLDQLSGLDAAARERREALLACRA